MTNAIYLQADTANGITAFDWADLEPNMEFLALDEFKEQLADMDEGDVIRAIVTHKGDPDFIKLKEEYGIRNIDGTLQE